MRTMLRIASDHPACAGHFPGNPIVPGAWLLAEVVREIAAVTGQGAVAAVSSTKFFHPVRPGDKVDIEYTAPAEGEIRFQCSVAGIRVMTGAIDGPICG